MGLVEDFILKIKQREGLRFDGQVAEFMGIDRRVLANYKHSDNLPFKLQEWYCDKYDVKLKDFHEDIEITNKNINIKKEDSVVDARYVIDLQKEKIEHQQAEINRLTAIVHKQKERKNKPAFHFKTKCDYDIKSKTFYNNIATGDTSMTGYTTKELSDMSPEDWTERYHPDSLDQLVKSANQDNPPDYVHNIYKHMLWKDKGGKYRMYNIESYYSKDEGVVRSYYYWVNGDIEGQS